MCVVCQAILNMMNLPALGNRHETHVQCEHCGVYLCIADREGLFQEISYSIGLLLLTGVLSISLIIIFLPHFFHFFSPQYVFAHIVCSLTKMLHILHILLGIFSTQYACIQLII